VSSENLQVVCRAPPAACDVAPLSRSGTHLRDRAAPFPRRLCATATVQSGIRLPGGATVGGAAPCYVWITDSGARGTVTGSACLCITFQAPSSRRDLGPLPDPAWRQPGVKVLHIADLDYETTCVRFVSCLEQVRGCSDANPRHVPLLILLELKQSDRRAVEQGGVVAPPWNAAALDGLDAEIRSVFGEDDMITPDDVRRSALTLEQSVREHGWPTLRQSRGKVAFLLDNEPGSIREAYIAGRPSLEGRVIFTNSRPGQPDAAFVKRNEPREANTAQIQELVRQGYLVRTRSDLPVSTVRTGDTSLLDAALRSGAHVVSTDFPEVGMSARYGSDFVARLPEGGPARCNPVNARRPCRSDRLEPR